MPNVLRLWRLAFHFLDFEKLEKSNGLRSEIAQGVVSPPLEPVMVEDAGGALPRPLLSSCAHSQLLCVLLLRAYTCHLLQSPAPGLLQPMMGWCRNVREQRPCLKLKKL